MHVRCGFDTRISVHTVTALAIGSYYWSVITLLAARRDAVARGSTFRSCVKGNFARQVRKVTLRGEIQPRSMYIELV